ncbi:MAG: helix-turn-helix domain-containing protein [Solirubrobacteraceae bacterium]
MQDSKSPPHTALYVRLPIAEAAKLDRAAFELNAAKQDLVAGLVARYVDPVSREGLEHLRELASSARRAKINPDGSGSNRPLEALNTGGETMSIGRHVFREAGAPEVLTVAQAADLLQATEDTITKLAEAGELPGRRIDGDWRFARSAVLDWLGGRDDA